MSSENGEAVNVREIIIAYLKKNGFDGLYIPGECGCNIDALMPCESNPDECIPGFQFPCDCGDHAFHVGPKKEKS